MKWLMNEESGQGMVEYGLILVLVSVVAIVALGAVGGKWKVKTISIVLNLKHHNSL